METDSKQAGSTLIVVLMLAGLVGAGAVLISNLGTQNSKNHISVLFSSAAQNLTMRAEAILSDRLACEDAFKGLPMPTLASPTHSKLPDNAIVPRLGPGEKGPAPLEKDATYEDGTIRVTDMQIVPGTTPGTYAFEMILDKQKNLRENIKHFSYGGVDAIKRRIFLKVAESTTTPGTIETCHASAIDDAQMVLLCASVGTHYDPAAQKCITCPNEGERIMGWNGSAPICMTIEKMICQALGSKAAWDLGAVKCVTCKPYENLVDLGGSPTCKDSVDVASLSATLGNPCAPNKAFYRDPATGTLTAKCN